ncbi:hypothetical protein ACFQ58_00975 [Agromyces sp. NPDC056523]|uniref:hypothetical protein n=1 Tax=Agromyces sp. NPDC056523 TaxID=3345850 RepID=UPI00366F2204
MDSSETDPAAAPTEPPVTGPDAEVGDTRIDETAPPRRIPWWVCLLVGIASAAIGLLPWLITGMRLPLQNLWATETLPEDMPVVLLPFSQYALTLIVAVIVTGAAVAGIAARAMGRRRPRFGAVLALVGLLAVQVIAVVQTSTVVASGLERRWESDLYLAALVGLAALSTLVGVLVMLLVAAAPRAGAVIGLSIAAVASVSWFTGLIVPFGSVQPTGLSPLLDLIRWIPPILVGAAIAWGGVNTVGRVIAALFGLVLLWIGPALITAVTMAAGSRALASDPPEMVQYALEVFRMALTTPSLVIPPLVVAVVVAAVGLVGRAVLRRSRRTDSTPPAGAADDDRSGSAS